MDKGDNKSTNVLVQETERLEERLQRWREVILAVDRVLRWEQSWHAGAMMAATSVLFLLIHCLNPSVLTGLSCTFMTVFLVENMVPTIAPMFLTRDVDEQQLLRFHEICSHAVKAQHWAAGTLDQLRTLKEEMPNMFLTTVFLIMVQLAKIGHRVNNLLLAYLVVSFLLLLPGLYHHDIIKMYTSMAKREISQLLTKKERRAVKKLLLL